jgi:hypothetical protein
MEKTHKIFAISIARIELRACGHSLAFSGQGLQGTALTILIQLRYFPD